MAVPPAFPPATTYAAFLLALLPRSGGKPRYEAGVLPEPTSSDEIIATTRASLNAVSQPPTTPKMQNSSRKKARQHARTRLRGGEGSTGWNVIPLVWRDHLDIGANVELACRLLRQCATRCTEVKFRVELNDPEPITNAEDDLLAELQDELGSTNIDVKVQGRGPVEMPAEVQQ